MLPALWVSKTGLWDMNLTTISNNLANVSTTGFKRDRAEFRTCCTRSAVNPAASPARTANCRPACSWVPGCA